MDVKGLTSTANCAKDPSKMTWQDCGMLVPHEPLRRMLLGMALAKVDTVAKAKRFKKWYKLFMGLLHHHHDMEEQVFFPAFEAKGVKMPQVFYDDHKELLVMLDKVKTLSIQCYKDISHSKALKMAIDELVNHVLPHLQQEEDTFNGLLRDHMTREEHDRLVLEIAKRSGLGGAKRFLPAIIYSINQAGGSYGPELTVEQFTAELPPPLRMMLPRWMKKFEKDNLGVIVSLAQ